MALGSGHTDGDLAWATAGKQAWREVHSSLIRIDLDESLQGPTCGRSTGQRVWSVPTGKTTSLNTSFFQVIYIPVFSNGELSLCFIKCLSMSLFLICHLLFLYFKFLHEVITLKTEIFQRINFTSCESESSIPYLIPWSSYSNTSFKSDKLSKNNVFLHKIRPPATLSWFISCS